MQNNSLIDVRAEQYAEFFSKPNESISGDILKITADELRYDDMISGYQVTGLIRLLIKITAAKNVAEIGMFTGFASSQMAMALPDDGTLYCLESNQRYIDIAVSKMEKAKWFEKVKIWKGDARINALDLPRDLDLVFLDADKEFYAEYYEIILEKLRPGGILVIDNIFWRGNIFDEAPDRKAAAIMKLSQIIKSDSRVDSVTLTVRDGLTVLMKRMDESSGI
jgi:caffeoyl-CoA O-methyltransferase